MFPQVRLDRLRLLALAGSENGRLQRKRRRREKVTREQNEHVFTAVARLVKTVYIFMKILFFHHKRLEIQEK